MKKIFPLVILLLSAVRFSSIASMPPDSIGVRKSDGKNYIIHRIEASEGWFSIARLYKISYAELRFANKDSADKLMPGRTLLIPFTKLKVDDPHFDKNYTQSQAAIFHMVKEGESFFSIAKEYNTKVDSLEKWNNISNDELKYGRKIIVGYSKLTETDNSKLKEPKSGMPAGMKKDEGAEKSNVPVKAETGNKKAETASEKNIVKADKKKINAVEGKPVRISGSVAADSVSWLNKEDVPDKGKSGKNVIELADSARQNKKSNADQTKIIKTAAIPPADSVKTTKPKTSVKAGSKKKGGAQPVIKPRREVSESGVASWIQDDDINPNKYYALHRTAPVGTIIKVTNKMNRKYVFVKVVGTLPDTGDNTDLVIKISKASAEKLGVRDTRFQSELSYGITEK